MTTAVDREAILAIQALTGAIAEAVAKDEQREGCDISAGLFGSALSDLLRTLAQKQQDCAKFEALLREFDAYSAHDKDYINSPFQQRVINALPDQDTTNDNKELNDA